MVIMGIMYKCVMGNGYKMREFKFRGWNKKYKVMLPVIQYIRPFKHIPTKTEAGYPAVRSEVGDKIFWRFGYREIEQENFIVMQYTGLKDKNGVEIYEGDILEEELDGLHDYEGIERFYTEFWDEQKAAFKLGGIKMYSASSGTSCCYATYLVKVGNKYENPELLERKTND